VSTTDKYDLLADGFSEREYADPVGYSARRARVISELGPRLEPGDTVLDVCCADGIMAAPLAELGLRYVGVDASENMLRAARLRNPGSVFVKGLMEEYAPREQVDLTICMRSFYLAEDQVAFFRHVGAYTKKKFIFDFWQSEHPADTVLRDLRLAGFSKIELRPFFTPQRRVLPAFLKPAVTALEWTGPLALLLSRRVGCVFCSATV
jgi:SAM-dependent methyltransferase